jgi:hypothetical protein
MSIIHSLKYKFLKRKIRFQKKLHPPYVPTEKEQKVIFIVKALIKSESSIMMIAPISGKKYIKDEQRGMFVIMNDTNIIISSNVNRFYYNILVNENVYKTLSRNFDNILENRRNKMEIETIAGITSNLDFIAKHMNDSIELN